MEKKITIVTKQEDTKKKKKWNPKNYFWKRSLKKVLPSQEN